MELWTNMSRSLLNRKHGRWNYYYFLNKKNKCFVVKNYETDSLNDEEVFSVDQL